MNNYYCKICDVDCKSLLEMLYHYDVEHKGICAFCNLLAFNNKSERIQHLSEEHVLHPCENCWQAFEDVLDLELHANSNGEILTHMFGCTDCTEDCETNTNLWAHRFLAHMHTCPLCGFVEAFDFSEKLPRDCHLKLKHNLFPCDECWNVFVSEVALQYHYMDKHRFTCEICNKTFENKMEKNSHFAIHNFKCLVCNESVSSETQLQHHYNTKHRVECTVCDKVVDSKDAMKEHFKLAHMLNCDLCEKMCSTVEELQLHYNAVHRVGELEGKQMHICSVCGGGFGSENDLVEHYEKLHVD